AETARVMAEAASAAHAAPASGRHLMLDLARCDEPSAQCNSVARAASRSLHAWQEHPQESAHQFGARLSSAAPYALFLMLPVFAAIVMLAYRNRHMLYGEHVVFGLHMHAFWFIALLASSLLPDSADLPVMLLVFIYGVWAMRRVYGGRWGATLLRAVFVSSAYLTLLLVGTVLLTGGLWLIG
ncbi:MAG TPA: hypothetical protein VJ743_00760, partial [Albitalea sp.]|nr:hypothetical protein [Albitalea sp.]